MDLWFAALVLRFLALGQYSKVWKALLLPPSPTLASWKKKTQQLCSFSTQELAVYRQQNGISTYSAVNVRRQIPSKITHPYAVHRETNYSRNIYMPG